jgi:hypothetical protein
MSRKEQIPIDRNVTLDKINFLIKRENNSRVLKDSILSKLYILEILLKKLLIKLERLRKQDITGKMTGIKAAMPP